MHFKTDESVLVASCRDSSCRLFDYRRMPFCGVAAFSTWVSYLSKANCKKEIEICPEELFVHVFKNWAPSPCGPANQIEHITQYWAACCLGPTDAFELSILNCGIKITGVKRLTGEDPLLMSEFLTGSIKKSTPVIVDFPLFASSFLPMGSPTLKRPNVGEPSLGRHFVIVDGFGCMDGSGYPKRANDFFTFQNCWGINWGNKGFGKLPFDFISATPSIRAYYLQIEG